MHEKVRYIKRPSYLGLREEDTAIWERFIEKFPEAYEEVIYNLHVGSGAEIPEGTAGNIATDFKLLTQFKIDVIGFMGDRLDIIEVKPHAGFSAMGQIKNYLALYRRDVNANAQLTGVLITDFERPDVVDMCREASIKYYVV